MQKLISYQLNTMPDIPKMKRIAPNHHFFFCALSGKGATSKYQDENSKKS